jgi:hypothetical protein
MALQDHRLYIDAKRDPHASPLDQLGRLSIRILQIPTLALSLPSWSRGEECSRMKSHAD